MIVNLCCVMCFFQIGVEIGWTRSTGLKKQNKMVSAAAKSLHSSVVVKCADATPLQANFYRGVGTRGGGNGGLSELLVARTRYA